MPVVIEVQSIKKTYFDGLTSIPGISQFALRDAQKVARGPDNWETVDDIEFEFPQDLLDDDEEEDVDRPAPKRVLLDSDDEAAQAEGSAGPRSTCRQALFDSGDESSGPLEALGGGGGEALAAEGSEVQFDGLALMLGVDGDDLEETEVQARMDALAHAELPASESAGGDFQSGEDAGPGPHATIFSGPGLTASKKPPSRKPPGCNTRFETSSGCTTAIHVDHWIGLAMLRARKAHLHLLSSHPVTGDTVIPFPPRTLLPSVTAEFESEVFELAHDDGERVRRDIARVRDGKLAEVPARYTNMSEDVQKVIQQTRLCIVIDCPDFAGTQYPNLHKCDAHVKDDVAIRGTGLCSRLCTPCRRDRSLQCFRIKFIFLLCRPERVVYTSSR